LALVWPSRPVPIQPGRQAGNQLCSLSFITGFGAIAFVLTNPSVLHAKGTMLGNSRRGAQDRVGLSLVFGPGDL
jgi:hypothetical protein